MTMTAALDLAPMLSRAHAGTPHPFAERYRAALQEIRAAGVQVLDQAPPAVPDFPYLVCFGGSAYQFEFFGGLPYYSQPVSEAVPSTPAGAEVSTIFFEFGGFPALRSAQVAVEAFRRQGLVVEWSGTMLGAVSVHTPFATASTSDR